MEGSQPRKGKSSSRRRSKKAADSDEKQEEQITQARLIQEIPVTYPTYKPKTKISLDNLLNRIQTLDSRIHKKASDIIKEHQEKKSLHQKENVENEDDSDNDFLIVEPPISNNNNSNNNSNAKPKKSQHQTLTTDNAPVKEKKNTMNKSNTLDELASQNPTIGGDCEVREDFQDSPSFFEPQQPGEQEEEKEEEGDEFYENLDMYYYVSESDASLSQESESDDELGPHGMHLEEAMDDHEINHIVKNILKGGWRKKYMAHYLNTDEQKELEGPGAFHNSKKATQTVEIDFNEIFAAKADRDPDNLSDDEAEEEKAYKAALLRKSLRLEMEAHSAQLRSSSVLLEDPIHHEILTRTQQTNTMHAHNSRLAIFDDSSNSSEALNNHASVSQSPSLASSASDCSTLGILSTPAAHSSAKTTSTTSNSSNTSTTKQNGTNLSSSASMANSTTSITSIFSNSNPVSQTASPLMRQSPHGRLRSSFIVKNCERLLGHKTSSTDPAVK